MSEAAAEAQGESPARRASFGARLAAAMGECGPLCVGIDPHPALLSAWGLADDVDGLRRFSLAVVEAVADLAAAVKPQVALYERHGARGLAVLEEVLAASAAAGVLSIADAKRGDIGSTMAAYADAWLGDGSPLAADAVTLSPYLGFESLRPALETAAATGRGAFVLALTSNPEGASVQHTGGDRSVAKAVCESAAAENARYAGEPLGSIGLVVGATVGDAVVRLGLDLAAMGGPILAPGLGAQGATGAALRETFGAAYGRVLGTSSRDILAGGPSRAGLRERTERTLAELA
ncbi:orotidine-5'-phosphate decarboxylase [Sinomonas sp. P47F7]|uniref:orotidine-5'-phosphate decarboxylase n=1 Tax=Sinomonas sp. P47F7 TaxID=3410987 RepID=UPI003BF6176A